MVAAQWESLLCNVVLMYAIGVFLEKLLLGNRTVREGDIAKLFIVFAAVYIGRAVFTGIGSHLSFAASTQVKRKLRELVYGNYGESIQFVRRTETASCTYTGTVT